MRLTILAAAAALGVSACGGATTEQANNTVNVDQAVLANDLAANDVTAIDAVTGDAADMAADVDINFTNEMIAATNDTQAGSTPARPRSPAALPRRAPASEPAPEPAQNAAGNATE